VAPWPIGISSAVSRSSRKGVTVQKSYLAPGFAAIGSGNDLDCAGIPVDGPSVAIVGNCAGDRIA
jgi:hypothetical protein